MNKCLILCLSLFCLGLFTGCGSAGYTWMRQNAPVHRFASEPNCDKREISCVEVGLNQCNSTFFWSAGAEAKCPVEVELYCKRVKQECLDN